MADETINEVIERVQADLNETRSIGAHTPAVLVECADVKALLTELDKLQNFNTWSLMDYERDQAELETVRSERDALLTWLERISLLASSGQDDTIVDTLQSTIRITREFAEEALSTAALNTPAAPQAEWTPRFRAGQFVTLHAGDERAQIVATYVNNRIDKYLVRWLDNDEIETRFDSELILYTEGIAD